MDNDLMARRLRPPSEQTQSTTTQPIAGQPPTVPWEVSPPPQLQSTTQTQPTPQVQPMPQPEAVHQSETVPPWDLAPVQPTEPPQMAQMQQPQPVEPPQPADTPQPTADLPAWPPAPAPEWPPAAATTEQVSGMEEAPSMPLAPESREEVPWDRPDDFEQPTDTAALDEQTTWDKPPDEAWAEPNPEWPPVANAVSQQSVESADPYDAYAPVLGDVAPTMSLAWPETNGHHTDLNGSAHTEWAEAAPDWLAPATDEATPATDWVAPEAEPSAPETQWVAREAESSSSEPDPSAPQAEWLAPEPEPAATEPEAVAHEPSFVAPEPPPVPAAPPSYAEHQMGPTPPDDLFFAATAAAVAKAPAEESEPQQEVENGPESEAEPAPEHFDAEAWLDETSAWSFEAPADMAWDPEFPPAPDVPMPLPLTNEVDVAVEAVEAETVEAEAPAEMFIEDETPAEVFDFAQAEMTAEPGPAAEPEMTAEPETTAEPQTTGQPETGVPDAPASPVVLRIELAIVDGQLQVVNSAGVSTAATAAASEPINVTPRNPEFDPRSTEAPVAEPEAVAPVSLAPLAPATEQVPWSNEVEPGAIPAASPAVPWADQMPEPAPETAAPWAQVQPSMDPLAAIPAQDVAPSSAQHDFTPQAAVASSIFAPPLQPYTPETYAPQREPFASEPTQPAPFVDMTPPAATPAVAAAALAETQNQNDLWFLSTEPDDIDAVTAEEDVVVPKESSSVLTAVLTIGMAILVIVLVLVFFSLMTSLLG